MKKPLTMHGKDVTDDQIQEWADEAEAGYDLTDLRRSPGRPRVGAGQNPRRLMPLNTYGGRMGSARRTEWPVFAAVVISMALVAWPRVSGLLTTGELSAAGWVLIIGPLVLLVLGLVGLVRSRSAGR